MERRQKVTSSLFQNHYKQQQQHQSENFQSSQEVVDEEVEVCFTPILHSPSNSNYFKNSNSTQNKIHQRDQINFSADKLSSKSLKGTGSYRWLILILSCFIMFGNFYAFDNPSALNRQLRTWMGDSSEVEFEFHLNLLYTIYSAPNIILPFIVGRALDRYGSRSFLIGLSLLMCLGQGIFSAGVSSRTWFWMLLGRLIFGLGGESLAVAQNRLVMEWFLGKELGVAIGLNLSVARIGTVFNNNASPRIANRSIGQGGGVSGACWIGLVTCIFSLICTFLCIFIDTLYRPAERESYSVSRMNFKSKNSSLTISTSIEDAIYNDDEFIHPVFYVLLVLNFLSYGTVLCFNTVASAYLQVRYFPGDVFKSNLAMSIPDTAAIFIVPLIGMAIDRSGWKLWTIGLGQAALALGHFFLAIFKAPTATPYFSLFILGIGYSTLLAIWSCVPYLVGSKCQATAYGYLTATTNLSSTILPILVAGLVSSDQSYFQVGMFFSLLSVSGLAVFLQISTLNSSHSLNLNSSRVPGHMVEFYQIKTKEKEEIFAIDNSNVVNGFKDSFNYPFGGAFKSTNRVSDFSNLKVNY